MAASAVARLVVSSLVFVLFGATTQVGGWMDKYYSVVGGSDFDLRRTHPTMSLALLWSHMAKTRSSACRRTDTSASFFVCVVFCFGVSKGRVGVLLGALKAAGPSSRAACFALPACLERDEDRGLVLLDALQPAVPQLLQLREAAQGLQSQVADVGLLHRDESPQQRQRLGNCEGVCDMCGCIGPPKLPSPTTDSPQPK